MRVCCTAAIASRAEFPLSPADMTDLPVRQNPLLETKHDPVADADAIRRAHLVLVRDTGTSATSAASKPPPKPSRDSTSTAAKSSG
jgi:hypothetical protein